MMMMMMMMMMKYSLQVPVHDWSRWKDFDGISPRLSPANFSSSSVGSRTAAAARSVAAYISTVHGEAEKNETIFFYYVKGKGSPYSITERRVPVHFSLKI